jgi:hypothetical protein
MIYLGGITLRPHTTEDHVCTAPSAVFDSWNRLDLARFGFQRRSLEVSYVRAAMRLYERLGFQRLGECQLWSPGPVTRTGPDDVRT